MMPLSHRASVQRTRRPTPSVPIAGQLDSRLPITTFGAITTREVSPGIIRAVTRSRDWDGQTRKVAATGPSRNAAQTVKPSSRSGGDRRGLPGLGPLTTVQACTIHLNRNTLKRT